MQPVDSHGYGAAVVGSRLPAARYRHHGMADRLATVLAACPNGMCRRALDGHAEHRQLRLLGQPG